MWSVRMEECQYIEDTERHDIFAQSTVVLLDFICFDREVRELISDEREEISS